MLAATFATAALAAAMTVGAPTAVTDAPEPALISVDVEEAMPISVDVEEAMPISVDVDEAMPISVDVDEAAQSAVVDLPAGEPVQIAEMPVEESASALPWIGGAAVLSIAGAGLLALIRRRSV